MNKVAAILLGAATLCSSGVAQSDSDGQSVETRARRAALARAGDAVAGVALRGDHVQRWLRDARLKAQRQRASCLDDLLSQVHAVERLARVEYDHVERLARGDAALELFDARLGRLDLYALRSQQLLLEAQACGGQVSRRTRVPSGYRVKVIKDG